MSERSSFTRWSSARYFTNKRSNAFYTTSSNAEFNRSSSEKAYNPNNTKFEIPTFDVVVYPEELREIEIQLLLKTKDRFSQNAVSAYLPLIDKLRQFALYCLHPQIAYKAYSIIKNSNVIQSLQIDYYGFLFSCGGSPDICNFVRTVSSNSVLAIALSPTYGNSISDEIPFDFISQFPGLNLVIFFKLIKAKLTNNPSDRSDLVVVLLFCLCVILDPLISNTFSGENGPNSAERFLQISGKPIIPIITKVMTIVTSRMTITELNRVCATIFNGFCGLNPQNFHAVIDALAVNQTIQSYLCQTMLDQLIQAIEKGNTAGFMFYPISKHDVLGKEDINISKLTEKLEKLQNVKRNQHIYLVIVIAKYLTKCISRSHISQIEIVKLKKVVGDIGVGAALAPDDFVEIERSFLLKYIDVTFE